MRRQGCQIGLLSVMFVEIANNAGDTFVVTHGVIVPLPDSRSHPILAAVKRRAGEANRSIRRKQTFSIDPVCVQAIDSATQQVQY